MIKQDDRAVEVSESAPQPPDVGQPDNEASDTRMFKDNDGEPCGQPQTMIMVIMG